jgi:hypothetical protein
MSTRRVLVVATVAIAALALTACGKSGSSGGKSTGGTSSTASGTPTATLTKDTLPIAVGTSWTIVHYEGNGLPIDMKVAGPWKIAPGGPSRTDAHEIVDPKTVPGIEKFTGVTFVDKGPFEGATVYYPRRVTDKWVDHLGTITVRGDMVEPKPLATPSHFWPLAFQVGDTYAVSESASGKIEAKVLARNTAEVPAGEIENTCLVRFTYTRNDGGEPTVYYYMFAPNVGFVALIHPSAGSESAGYTAAKQIDVLGTLPAKR